MITCFFPVPMPRSILILLPSSDTSVCLCLPHTVPSSGCVFTHFLFLRVYAMPSANYSLFIQYETCTRQTSTFPLFDSLVPMKLCQLRE